MVSKISKVKHKNKNKQFKCKMRDKKALLKEKVKELNLATAVTDQENQETQFK